MKVIKNILTALLVLIIVLVAYYYVFPEKVAGYIMDATRIQARLAKKEIKIDDHNIVYLEGGKGPTILLLHGYAGYKDVWIMLAPYLTKNYHVVVPDIPGYGESSMIEKDSYDLSNQMPRLHKFVQAIGLKKFHIAGHSMGGLFAGTYAALYPDEIISVGLFDAAGVTHLEKSIIYQMIEKDENPLIIKDSHDWQRLMTILFANKPFTPYPLEKVMIKTYLVNRIFYEKELKEVFPDFYSLEKKLPKIKAPALILWGDKDKIIDISSVPVFEKGLKYHKTVIIKDCGHCPMIEKPKDTAAAYQGFLKGIN